MYSELGQRQLINVHTCGSTLLTEYDFGGYHLYYVSFYLRYMISQFGQWTNVDIIEIEVSFKNRRSSYLPFENIFNFYLFFFFFNFLKYIYMISKMSLRHFKDPTQLDRRYLITVKYNQVLYCRNEIHTYVQDKNEKKSKMERE